MMVYRYNGVRSRTLVSTYWGGAWAQLAWYSPRDLGYWVRTLGRMCLSDDTLNTVGSFLRQNAENDQKQKSESRVSVLLPSALVTLCNKFGQDSYMLVVSLPLVTLCNKFGQDSYMLVVSLPLVTLCNKFGQDSYMLVVSLPLVTLCNKFGQDSYMLVVSLPLVTLCNKFGQDSYMLVVSLPLVTLCNKFGQDSYMSVVSLPLVSCDNPFMVAYPNEAVRIVFYQLEA